MFKGLTPRAHKVLTILAQEEAKRFHSGQLLPEHVVLALLKNGEGVAVQALQRVKINVAEMQEEIERTVPKVTGGLILGDVPPSRRALKMLETSAEEASSMEHDLLGTEHFLLAAARERDGVVMRYLQKVQRTAMLRERGTPCILGLRDVMDDPELLAPEWERKNAVPALAAYYDDIWVYGLPQICDPLQGITLPRSVRKKMTYTGYLDRSVPKSAPPLVLEKISEPYLLITVGGGGDGDTIIDWVLRAYEAEPDLSPPALFVLGPFMGSELQSDFLARASRLDNVEAITFDAHLESVMERAAGVVCMGGYNTFCEILSLDKRALVIPRTEPRREQYIRAQRASDLGLVDMLLDDGVRSAESMVTALKTLPQRRPPSEFVVPGLLDGRENVRKLAKQWLRRRGARIAVAEERKSRARG